ncbi:ATP synthase F1 subunit delta [Patescibacteria group bacterium AH-259-L07]|nr:ATP synthase F1 subunit delta [Patescibacteria group bacterium AH-259-L07]
MSYTSQQYAHALYECIKDAKKSEIHPVKSDKVGATKPQFNRVKTYINNLYNILVKNNDVVLFKEMLDKVSSIDKRKRNIVEVIIISSHALDNNVLKQIQQALPYKKTQIKQVIEPKLIGGIKIQIGDTVIDGSIKKQLNSLKQQLK